jgi:hypothetical protein
MKHFLYFLFFSLLLISACKKDDKTVAPPLSIKSFLPNSGNPGTIVTIQGTGFSRTLTSNTVNFNGTAAQVLSANDTMLVVSAPEKGTTGVLAVSVGGHSVQGATYTFQALSVHAIAPMNGPAGTSVTISGTGFTSVDSPAVVTVNGIRAIVTNANDTTLVITIPAGAGPGPIHVAVNGENADGPTFSFQAISAIMPASGGAGTVVTITGQGFSTNASDNQVAFNGLAAQVQSATSTTLTVVAPANVQTGPVSVTMNGQKTSGPVFTVVPAPVISAVAPLSGPVGAVVTISGKNFSAVRDENQVTLNGMAVTVTSATAMQLTFVVPSGATSGALVVTVNGQPVTGPNYTIQSLGVSALLPDNGLAGTVVTVKGYGFDPSPANDQVTINGQTLTVSAATDTTLTITMPTGISTGALHLSAGGLTATGPTFRRAGVTTLYSGALVSYLSPGMVVDSKGYIYVALNGAINKIAPDGSTAAIWAGDASAGGYADGQGTNARFLYISGLTIDAQDNIYVADGGNAAIRKITPDGTVSTLYKGTPFTPKYPFLDPQGNLYFGSDYSGVGKITPGGAYTQVTNNLGANGQLVYYNGYIFFGNPNQQVIDRYSFSLNSYAPYVGTFFSDGYIDGPAGTNRLYGPGSCCYDPTSGLVYFIDGNNYSIRAFNPADGSVTTITGAAGTRNAFTTGHVDGTLQEALFSMSGNSPLFVDKNGNIYLLDGSNGIREIFLQ